MLTSAASFPPRGRARREPITPSRFRPRTASRGRDEHRRSAAAAALARVRKRVRKSICIAALGGLLTATPANAHTIDVHRAAAAVRAQAQTLGEVDQARCWRPIVGTRRLRHRAVCVASWVHTARAACTIFYEVRLARHPSRRLKVIQTFQPWCASAGAPAIAEGRGQ
jgi:hypothetical protein